MSSKNYEKATVNIPIVDLGKIDYLVEQGYYNSRAEFIRIAIEREASQHDFSFEVIDREGVTQTKTRMGGFGSVPYFPKIS